MRNGVVLLVLLFSSYAMAENSHPAFLILRQNERMVLLGPPGQNSFDFACAQPIFNWEGTSSVAHFATGAEGITAEFKLDIIGPDWLYVTLAEGEGGLTLTLRRTNSDGSTSQALEARFYPNYTAVLADADYSPFISALLRRCGQNPLLPDLECLRTTLFGVDPPADRAMDAECESLIQRLDDPHWQVRHSAAQKLAEPGRVQHAIAVAHRMNLSPEQRARLDSVAGQYAIDVQNVLFDRLVSLEFPDADLAMAPQD